jgi:integrase
LDEQIDVRGDGRIVLYRRSNSANGVYHVRLRIPGSNGYKRLSTKHSKRQDAEHFALNLYEELYFHVRDGGSLNAPKFSKAFDAWKKACAKKKTTLKKGSWENTIQRVEMYALDYFGETQIDKIGRKEISSYVTWRYDNYKRKPPTEDSLKRECTALRSFFRYLHETGAIPKPPEFPRELNQKKNNRRPTFTQNEWRKIGRNLREWVKAGKPLGKWRDRFVAHQYFLTLANTGMRIGEARNLRWKDLRSVDTDDGTRLIADVDGKTGRREVVFQKGADVFVKRLYDLRKEELNAHPSPEEPVFLSKKTGQPYTSFKRSFASMLNYCEIPAETDKGSRTIYSLRHFYATIRLIEGVSPFLLSKQMGTSVEMLEKFYGHVITSEVADRISKTSAQHKPSAHEDQAYPFQ